jgi:hypothetical protein
VPHARVAPIASRRRLLPCHDESCDLNPSLFVSTTMSYASARVPSLPPELVSAIVRYTVTREPSPTAPPTLSAEVVAVLRHTALVARAWRAPSQAELFFCFSLCAEYADSLQVPRLLFLCTRPHLARCVRVLALSVLLLPLHDMARWLPYLFPFVAEVYVGTKSAISLAPARQLHLPLPLLAGFSRLKKLWFISVPTPSSETPQENIPDTLSDMSLQSIHILSASQTTMEAIQGIKRSGSAQSLQSVGLHLITQEMIAVRTALEGFTNLTSVNLTLMWTPGPESHPIDPGVHISGACFLLPRVDNMQELTTHTDFSIGSLPNVIDLILTVSGDAGGINVLRMLFTNAELVALRSLLIQMILLDGTQDEAGNFVFLPADTFASDVAHPPILSDTISRQLTEVDIRISATQDRPMVAEAGILHAFAGLFGPASKDPNIFTLTIENIEPLSP